VHREGWRSGRGGAPAGARAAASLCTRASRQRGAWPGCSSAAGATRRGEEPPRPEDAATGGRGGAAGGALLRWEAWLQRKTEPRLEQRVHAEGGKERLARMGARVLGQPEWGGRISVPQQIYGP
jgi:hypothetical protein